MNCQEHIHKISCPCSVQKKDDICNRRQITRSEFISIMVLINSKNNNALYQSRFLRYIFFFAKTKVLSGIISTQMVQRPIQHLHLYVSAPSKTPLHRSVQRMYFRELFIMHSRDGSVYSHSFILATSVDGHHWNHSKHQKPTDQLLVVVSSPFSHCAWHRRPSFLIRFVQCPELQGDAQTTSLSHSVCTSAAPKNQKQIAHCTPRQRTLSSRTSALMLCTRHLESRTHHNLSNPLLRLELLVLRVESPTPRFSS